MSCKVCKGGSVRGNHCYDCGNRLHVRAVGEAIMCLRGGNYMLMDVLKRQAWDLLHEATHRVKSDVFEFELSIKKAKRSRRYSKPTKTMFGETTREVIDIWDVIGKEALDEAKRLLAYCPTKPKLKAVACV